MGAGAGWFAVSWIAAGLGAAASPAGSLDLIERQQLQVPVRRWQSRREGYVLFDRLEAEHFHFESPRSIRQVGKTVSALLVGNDRLGLVSLACGYGYAGDAEACEFDLTVLFGSVEEQAR